MASAPATSLVPENAAWRSIDGMRFRGVSSGLRAAFVHIEPIAHGHASLSRLWPRAQMLLVVPSPRRSRIYTTSAGLECRTRASPLRHGERCAALHGEPPSPLMAASPPPGSSLPPCPLPSSRAGAQPQARSNPCRQTKDEGKRLKCYDRLDRPSANARERPGQSRPGGDTAWVVTDEKSPLDDSPLVSAALASTDN